MSPLPPSWFDAIAESEQRQSRANAVPRWKHWRLPLLLAVLGHASIGLLLVQQKWQRPLSPEEPARAIEAYFYQPPLVVSTAEQTMPLDEPEPAEPEEQVMALDMLEEAAAITAEQNEAPADATAPTAGLPQPSFESVLSSQSLDGNLAEHRGSLMDRALQQLQSTDGLARTHRTEQQRRFAEPKITVERRFQQLSSDPAKQVVAQFNDGTQIIRTKNGCRLADPSKDGFEGLMAARRIPCGDEEDASQQLNRILQRRTRP
ncbi:hypothetical protein QWY20_17155 [Alkalimonas sp. MEB108]|uniref:Uncharacterized protein n=1 Tax=Alkalimonas cellulosilytica TaxID=3058395 RepID=A0ABU7JBC6_9GAMM|nr:hypothetical protein [Alkalimonas sp. MEB108]MEE2003185.1 hypothetical protein [Alkalimonas sp. MEB108]